MTSLDVNMENRKDMLRRLRAEVVGPDPAGKPVSLAEGQSMSWEEFRLARCQHNGEEIVWQDAPTKRYGAGILFPQGVQELIVNSGTAEVAELPSATGDLTTKDALIDEKAASEREKQAAHAPAVHDEDEGVSLANSFRPSAIGLSLLADLSAESQGIVVEMVSVGRIAGDSVSEIPCGRYAATRILLGKTLDRKGVEGRMWRRHPVTGEGGGLPAVSVTARELLDATRPLRFPIAAGPLQLELVVVSRSWKGAATPSHRLLTISVVNKRKAVEEQVDEACLFQAGLRVSGTTGLEWIDPYPDYLAGDFRDPDAQDDENVNRVLYRRFRTFALGHGCAADWVHGRPQRVSRVWTDVLPVFETPSTSAELLVRNPDGTTASLRAGMRQLAGLIPADDGLADADTLLAEYRAWIAGLESMVVTIAEADRPTATQLIIQCRRCADRISDGLLLLRSGGAEGENARTAFRLANHAMLIAQLRTRQPTRMPAPQPSGGMSWDRPAARPDPAAPDPKTGYWRPFQIAFILMSLRGIVDPVHEDRDAVDLIWFPTGGGKTEAYLGLTAFTVFHNAITKAGVAGVEVLMRYTLRLLTAQQFQRAATLFCAMEHLRRRDPPRLGDRPFRIGLWVGGSATPNHRADAIERLRALQKDPDAENPFVLLRCPWCSAHFGPAGSHGGSPRTGPARRGGKASLSHVLGYSRETVGSADTVVFRCGDHSCEFGGMPNSGSPPLPIVVIDDDLLESPPNLLIGTVDKFAMLAWTEAARGLFGIEDTGRHRGAPPTLIIQDELHLISGPLGSMVGAYETVIEALCIDPHGGMVRPKIVASTATISRAKAQVKALYARNNVALFPPSGLDATDSFFAREAVHEDGTPQPGRLYAGVLAPAHGSVQTSEARIFATLMQHAALLEGEAAGLDPWWTLLVFFNSLRELGGALTLFSADTREYLKVILSRHGVEISKIRKLYSVEELTSRIRGDHIPRLLDRLELRLTAREDSADSGQRGPTPLDACLASNIIEVGVDVPRLSLMAIVGQPKTTSQYIQVSSRIGRDASRPGLVTIIYGQTKPRDRSHYERFRSYHQKLYAQVEPTSVTPFSPPAVDRALHGLIVALVRQLGALRLEGKVPDPFPLSAGTGLRSRLEEIVRNRVQKVAASEESFVMELFRKRLDQWAAWNPGDYGGFYRAPPEDAPLMHPAGSATRPEWDGRSWPTMTSMRNVDASCEADITDFYRPVPGGTA